jgi:hypothetical protein
MNRGLKAHSTVQHNNILWYNYFANETFKLKNYIFKQNVY